MIESNMYKGIIYKYTAPSGKVYIGQTVDEQKRRSDFLNVDKSYAGDKINRARRKYVEGRENQQLVLYGDIKNR